MDIKELKLPLHCVEKTALRDFMAAIRGEVEEAGHTVKFEGVLKPHALYADRFCGEIIVLVNDFEGAADVVRAGIRRGAEAAKKQYGAARVINREETNPLPK